MGYENTGRGSGHLWGHRPQGSHRHVGDIGLWGHCLFEKRHLPRGAHWDKAAWRAASPKPLGKAETGKGEGDVKYGVMLIILLKK